MGQKNASANARRIVACVNACAGIETERLESGSPEWWGRYVRDDRPAMEREIAKLRAEREELQKRVDGFRDEFLEKALEWRGISFVDEACDGCGGSGVVAYGSTATWHGGIGGQAITNGVCDKCWGSGNRLHKWADLRKLRAALAEKGE
jgi:hypothetical protein